MTIKLKKLTNFIFCTGDINFLNLKASERRFMTLSFRIRIKLFIYKVLRINKPVYTGVDLAAPDKEDYTPGECPTCRQFQKMIPDFKCRKCTADQLSLTK